jgi:hypothetical protein
MHKLKFSGKLSEAFAGQRILSQRQHLQANRRGYVGHIAHKLKFAGILIHPEGDNVVGILIGYPHKLSFQINEKIPGYLSFSVLLSHQLDHARIIDSVYRQ